MAQKPDSERPAEEGTVATARALLRLFRAAHAEGMVALKRKDYGMLTAAIQREREIIVAQRVLIDEEHAMLRRARRKR